MNEITHQFLLENYRNKEIFELAADEIRVGHETYFHNLYYCLIDKNFYAVSFNLKTKIVIIRAEPVAWDFIAAGWEWINPKFKDYVR